MEIGNCKLKCYNQRDCFFNYLLVIVEDELPAIIFHIQPVPRANSDLHNSFKKPNLLSPLFPLEVDRPFIIGRGSVDLHLNDVKASRRHMELSACRVKKNTGENIQFKIKNLSDKKPIKINHDTCLWDHMGTRQLKPSDVLQIGQITFRVEINCTAYSKKGQYILEVKLPDDDSNENTDDGISSCDGDSDYDSIYEDDKNAADDQYVRCN